MCSPNQTRARLLATLWAVSKHREGARVSTGQESTARLLIHGQMAKVSQIF